jgi:hypothetical protein
VLSEDVESIILCPILFCCEICQSVASIPGRSVNYKLKMIRREATSACLCVFLEGTR